MKKILIFMIPILLVGCKQDRYTFKYPKVNSQNIQLLPVVFTSIPDLPSPLILETNREVVLAKFTDNSFSWVDATVENGEPFDYKCQLYGKGNQLMADEIDFATLARKGIHSDLDLQNAKTITGRSVAQITIDGRPWCSSGVGFMAKDETIMSVIYGDNEIVKTMQLTHPDMARPLFHLWNISREVGIQNEKAYKNLKLQSLIYNEHEVFVDIQGSRGWQESIFNDEILGTGHIRIWRDLNNFEISFIKSHYPNLSDEQLNMLIKKLSHIHTGEMVFFYINRYGFYEGHAEYRADPVSVALVFGLRNIEELNKAAGENLYHYFTTHFTKNPE